MAPKGKSPLRKISRLGLDQLLSQIVGQASGQTPNQFPPTGTTTTSMPGPPSPGPPRSLDANGDYFVAEGLPAGATPGTQAAPQAAPMPASQPGYPPTGTTAPSALNQFYAPVNTSAAGMPVDGVNAQPTSTPVNGSSSKPTVSTYRNIGEIFAEQPPSDDPQTLFNFNRSRLDKIGRFYNLSDEELQQAQANVAGALGMAVQKPGITPVEAQSIANQLFQAEGTRIIKANDAKAYGNNDPRMSPPPFVGTDPNAPPEMQSDQNPLSVYGVYTPEQIAAIQGQIGMYTNQMQDRFSQAAGGWKPSAAMQDAYARQAQAIPAVQALEGQAALAQALAAEKEKNNYYTTLLQQRSSDASSSGGSSGAMSDEDMTNFVNSLTGGR